MRRDDRPDILHMRLRESPMFRDIRVIKINPVHNNRREDVDKTRQCIPHKLDTLRSSFIGRGHQDRAAFIDFKSHKCIQDSLNLSELGFGLFAILLEESDDRCFHLLVRRM